ncbi:MAG TPA: hypothetical protein VD994_11515 [Prosthecobacter sp.]|nr:hypothetical protein [Prosthecobacter sp.]
MSAGITFVKVPELKRKMHETVSLHHGRDGEAVRDELRFHKGRAHGRAFAHFEIGIAAPDFAAVVAVEDGNVDGGAGHVRADFGYVRDEHDGAAEHHLHRRNFATVLPDAFLQDGVEEHWLAHQLALHLERAKTVLDFEHPTALVHFPPNGDDIVNEALAHVEDTIEITGDFGGGKKHLHIGRRCGIDEGSEAFAAFFNRKGDEFFNHRVTLFHLFGPVGASGGVVGVWRHIHGVSTFGDCRRAFSSASRFSMSLGCFENDSKTSPTTRSARTPSLSRMTFSASGFSTDRLGS